LSGDVHELPWVDPGQSLRDAIAVIDRCATGIALVVDEERRLLGTLTDGDVRRAILADVDVELAVGDLLRQPPLDARPAPVTAAAGTADAELLHLMNERSVRQVPLLDADGRVAGLAQLSELLRDYEAPMTAVVMAGGLGTRLRPLTADLPKPMLPVGDRPLLERIIDQLKQSGVRRLHVTTHYKGAMIADHFGDGARFGVDIRYVDEDQPLGTAGSLKAIAPTDEPLLVINGDILTQVNFRAMLEFHREHAAAMTVALRDYRVPVPYGVVECDGIDVTAILEKPVIQRFINAGIYLVEGAALAEIPSAERFDMTDLIDRLLATGGRVIGFPVHEYWLDIGQAEDYQRAQRDVASGKVRS
jgi:dTDP-glucose pyrophosphorylase/CBS domain-containing protein